MFSSPSTSNKQLDSLWPAIENPTDEDIFGFFFVPNSVSRVSTREITDSERRSSINRNASPKSVAQENLFARNCQELPTGVTGIPLQRHPSVQQYSRTVTPYNTAQPIVSSSNQRDFIHVPQHQPEYVLRGASSAFIQSGSRIEVVSGEDIREYRVGYVTEQPIAQNRGLAKPSNPEPPPRARRFLRDEIRSLVSHFARNQLPCEEELEEIAYELQTSVQKVDNWFIRERRKQRKLALAL